jgi:hypothetical protein
VQKHGIHIDVREHGLQAVQVPYLRFSITRDLQPFAAMCFSKSLDILPAPMTQTCATYMAIQHTWQPGMRCRTRNNTTPTRHNPTRWASRFEFVHLGIGPVVAGQLQLRELCCR